MRLEEMMKKYENVSLRKIAAEYDICYQYLLKASKKPIVGVVFDENFVNYDELERLITKKVKIEDIDWNNLNITKTKFKASKDLNGYEVGSKFRFRYDDDDEVRTIVFRNEGYLVHISNKNEKPSVMNNEVFLHQSPRLVKDIA